MGPRSAILVDADQWSAKSLFALVEHARSKGEVCSRDAFGAFEGPSLLTWKGHFATLRFTLHTATGTNAADDALLDRAAQIAHDDLADILLIATHDKKLLSRIAKHVRGGIALLVAEDPESSWVPERMIFERIHPAKQPIPPEVRERMRAEFQRSTAGRSEALFSDLGSRLSDLPFRDLGRENALELFRDSSDEFAIVERDGGGALTVRLRI